MKYIYLTASSRSISRPKIFDTLEEAQEQMKTDFIEVAYLNNRIIRLDYQDEFELENVETEEEPVNNIINYSIRDNFGECAITDTEAYVTNTVDNTKWNAQIFTREE